MKNAKVLIVDDDAAVLEVIEAVFKNAGYNPICVTNGYEVFKKITEEIPDVILLDICMPGIDGLMVKSWLNADKKTSDIPVIFVTAKDTEIDTKTALKLGAHDYIVKPFDIKELLERIEKVINKKNSL